MISNLLAWFAQVLALAAVAGLAPILLRVHAPRAQTALLHVVLALALVLPVIQPWRQPSAAQSTISRYEVSGRQAVRQRPLPTPEHGIDWERATLILIAMGVSLRAVWLTLGLIRLRSYRRNATAIESHAEAERLTGSRADFRLSSDVTSPVTFGVLRPVVLVPPTFASLPPDQQTAIACHELLHVKRRDWWFCLAEELAVSALWFHPALWYVRGRIRALREQAVDAEVVRLTSERESYVAALLSIAQQRPMPDLVPSFLRRRQLTQRVRALAEERRSSWRRIFAAYLCASVMLVCTGILAITTFPLTGAPQPPANMNQVHGVVARIDVSRLPEPVQSRVDAAIRQYRNQPFTPLLMSGLRALVTGMDENIICTWVMESPGVFSLTLQYKTGSDKALPKIARIDASRLPDRLRVSAEARMNEFRHADFTEDVLRRIEGAASAIDSGVSCKWLNEPDGTVSLQLAYDASFESWNMISGLLSTIDVSQMPEPIRTQMDQQLGRYRNAPFTNALMQEIGRVVYAVDRKAAMMWRSRGNSEFSLTVLSDAKSDIKRLLLQQ